MIGVIEKAMIERLKAASTLGVLGYALREVDSLPSADMDLKALAETIKSFPSAWTCFDRFQVLNTLGSGKSQIDAVFHLVVAARSARNQQATRFTALPNEPGSYQLMLDAAGLLVGQDLGLPIGGVRLTGGQSLYSGQMAGNLVSLMSLSLAVRFDFDPNQGGVDASTGQLELGDFATFSVAWDIAPHGGVDGDPDAPGVQLPADETADAADLITLQPPEPAS